MTHILHPEGDITLNLTTTTPPTTILVSSPHLILASPYFRAMLTGNFPEAIELRQNKKLTLTLAHDNAEAMLTVMNAVHGKFWDIPTRRIKLELLKDIAVVVDKYDLFDSICTLAPTWIETVVIGRTRRMGQTGVNLLTVMWVFNLQDEWKRATKDLITEYAIEMDFRGTCIPSGVGDQITSQRKELVRNLRAAINRQLTAYNIAQICDPKCDETVKQRLEQFLVTLRRKGRTKVKPSTSRAMIGALYDDLCDDHKVKQNMANDPNYVQPMCVCRLKLMDAYVDAFCDNVDGLNLKKLKGDACRPVIWGGRAPVLDFERLWPWA